MEELERRGGGEGHASSDEDELPDDADATQARKQARQNVRTKCSEFKMTHQAPTKRSLSSHMVSLVARTNVSVKARFCWTDVRAPCVKIMTIYSAMAWRVTCLVFTITETCKTCANAKSVTMRTYTTCSILWIKWKVGSLLLIHKLFLFPLISYNIGLKQQKTNY